MYGWIWDCWAGVAGACVGSFINVVIVRLSKEVPLSLLARSSCPSCQTRLNGYDLIPLLSWVLLRGRCRSCLAKISWRYPFNELLLGIFGVICWRFSQSWIEGIEHFIALGLLVCIAWLDYKTWTIPISLLAVLIINGWTFGFLKDSSLFYERLALTAGVFAFFAAFLLLSTWILRRAGRIARNEQAMGWGDPILMAGIAANLPWYLISGVVLLGSIQGLIAYGLFPLIRCYRGTDSWLPPAGAVPYGVFLSLAAIEIKLYIIII